MHKTYVRRYAFKYTTYNTGTLRVRMHGILTYSHTALQPHLHLPIPNSTL